jgi:hypothetical protein
VKQDYEIGRKEVNIIRYADDSVFIADNEDNLQRLLYQFSISCRNYGMKTVINKTKK